MKLFSISAALLLLLVSPVWAADSWTEEMRRAVQPCPFEPFKEMLSTPSETNWTCNRAQLDAGCDNETVEKLRPIEKRMACDMIVHDMLFEESKPYLRGEKQVTEEGETCSDFKEALKYLNMAKDAEISYARFLKPDADLTWLPAMRSIIEEEMPQVCY